MSQPPFEFGNNQDNPGDLPPESHNPEQAQEPGLVIASLRAQLAIARERLARTEERLISTESRLALSEEVSIAAGEHIEYLEDRFQIDPLMRIGNRVRLERVYDRLVRGPRAHRHGERSIDGLSPDAVLMVDADHFKDINDTYGHPVGDRVLRELGGIVQSSVRENDEPGRYGGEEIAVILPDTDELDAWTVAERIQSNVAGHRFTDHQLEVTVSIGVGPLVHGENISDGVRWADLAVYTAKMQGRNQVMMYSDIDLGTDPDREP